ncbi:MAG: FAD:protein FMN transferase [Saprospiraceae bacterium]|nr:FAD:protein FMN transferase [Saprospiraceae bacterium]
MNIFRLFSFIIIGLLLNSCRNENVLFHKITGKTMGTTYHITAQTANIESLQLEIDSLLLDFNNSLSTYIPTSTISKFNTADSMLCFTSTDDVYFIPVFEKSKEVFRKTEGYFDPSIMPLVNYYGFGYTEKKKVVEADTAKIKELLKLLQFDKVSIFEDSIQQICILKEIPNVQLDFSALAKGYGVDIIAEFLEKKNIRNYLVEIGGEVRALGLNDKGKEWVIGINKPSESATPEDIELPLKISNRAVATSGNYRNVYESKGQQFAHIIDPKTGFSRQTDILSATVIAKDCMTADAYATAFMVMGMEKSLELIEQLNDIEACFIYDAEGDGIFEFRISTGFSGYFLHNEQK